MEISRTFFKDHLRDEYYKELRFKAYITENIMCKYAILGYTIENIEGFEIIKRDNKVLICCYEGIEFPKDSSQMFEDMSFSRVYLQGVDTSLTESMKELFANSDAIYIDMRGIDTRNVKNLEGMCNMCTDLVKLDWDGLDFSKVENISTIFCHNWALKEINLNAFNSGSLIDISYMLHGISDTYEIILDKMNTKNVKYMDSAFCSCNVPELDLSNWDVGKVLSLKYFMAWSNVEKLNIDCFDEKTRELILREMNHGK